ncbi:hypothetical protein VZQ01_04530 [Myxococcus faecalis]|uniref:hypothetical protein n=1 Tax=Myxococcus faecalis TaxID=3115646 RepID=UPI003CFB8953
MRVHGVSAALMMSLFTVGCGGVEAEAPAEVAPESQQQALYDGCAPGDTGYPVWECLSLDECGGRWGNQMRYYCYTPGGGMYLGSVITSNCAECY